MSRQIFGNFDLDLWQVSKSRKFASSFKNVTTNRARGLRRRRGEGAAEMVVTIQRP